MRWKMIVTDLDGTLFDRSGVVSLRTAMALDALREKGVVVVFATGRAFRECITPLGRHLEGRHLIGAGGATIHDATGRLLDVRAVCPVATKACAESINAAGQVAHLLHDESHDDHHYSMIGTGTLDAATQWWIDSFQLLHRRHDVYPPECSPVIRVSAVAPEHEIAPIAQAIARSVPDAVTLRHWPALTASGIHSDAPHMLEIHAAGVHKWSAAQTLCARMGIDADDVVAFGDGPNDVEMLAGAGLGIVMDNGWEVAKSAADECAPHHGDDGFALMVERLLAGK
ncbi:MAG: HAD hydrolase family protein [Planctomycetota bacterium]|nr:HAD hydrolase family protein [Planctomycetota bacterium]